jgi:Arc/MetJ family transcription regulator
MNNKRDDVSISRAELVVLARFSGSKKPKEEDLSADLLRLTAGAKSTPNVRSTLEALTGRGLLASEPGNKRGKSRPSAPGYRITDLGARALSASLGLSGTPTWAQVRDEHLPSLGLGLAPGSAAASEARASVAMTMVRMKLKMPKDASLTEICDALLFRKLGFRMSKITLAELRARLLAEALEVSQITTAKNVVDHAVRAWLHTKDAKKQSLGAALARDWVSGQVNHWLDGGAASAPPLAGSAKGPDAAPPAAVSLDTLADVVHEALPLVGSDGRYGSEKVFVSAVWRGLEKERRVAGMTLDSFKRSLVQAMRAGKVRLARADLIGAMDAKLVSDSEILDNGSTFHFVLEQKNGAQGADRRSHVR